MRKLSNESTSYKEIKYNSNSVQKKELKNNCSSAELPRKETPTPKRVQTVRQETTVERSLAPFGLTQN